MGEGVAHLVALRDQLAERARAARRLESCRRAGHLAAALHARELLRAFVASRWGIGEAQS